ncbi:hypothetical protein SLA2020_151330 [Shorea laevis]
MQVEGQIMVGVLPPNDNTAFFATNGKAKALFEARTEYPPVCKLENGVWSARFVFVAIPSFSPNGNSLFSLWRRLDDATMVMFDQL